MLFVPYTVKISKLIHLDGLRGYIYSKAKLKSLNSQHRVDELATIQ
jgi:hypothetical protein